MMLLHNYCTNLIIIKHVSGAEFAYMYEILPRKKMRVKQKAMPLMMIFHYYCTNLRPLSNKKQSMLYMQYACEILPRNACEVIKLEGNAPDDVITQALAVVRSQGSSGSSYMRAMIGIHQIPMLGCSHSSLITHRHHTSGSSYMRAMIGIKIHWIPMAIYPPVF